MSISKQLKKMKDIEVSLLQYIDCDYNYDEYFAKLIKKLDDLKIRSNQYELKSFLYILSKISQYHRIINDFYDKIFKILNTLKKDIMNNFSQNTLFGIFKDAQRVVLYLIEEKILVLDEAFASKLYKDGFLKRYFIKEIKQFIKIKVDEFNDDDDEDEEEKYGENFEKYRKNGENPNHICELIRNDSIKEFISYVEKEEIDLNESIPSSLFDRDSYYYIIEHAIYFGSIQIFEYCLEKKVDIKYKMRDIWENAVQSKNPEMIFILEEKNLVLDSDKAIYIYQKALQCFHYDIANYIKTNYKITKDTEDPLRNHNYSYITKKMIEKNYGLLFQYDYLEIVNILLKTKGFDINDVKVLYHLFVWL